MEVNTDSPTTFEKHVFRLPDGKILLAIWVPERSRKARLDDYAGVTVDIAMATDVPRRIIGIDLLNGREQVLRLDKKADQVFVPDLIVKDYPLLLRLEY